MTPTGAYVLAVVCEADADRRTASAWRIGCSAERSTGSTSPHPPDAAVLVRDSDGQQERRLGLEQARRERNWPFQVVIGFADPMRECWVLAGFEPRSEAEGATLTQLQQEFGLDPLGALRDAKRVLRLLVGNTYDREQSCWTDCRLEDLIEHGRLNGLADYLEEVRTRLVPLFTGGEARS